MGEAAGGRHRSGRDDAPGQCLLQRRPGASVRTVQPVQTIRGHPQPQRGAQQQRDEDDDENGCHATPFLGDPCRRYQWQWR